MDIDDLSANGFEAPEALEGATPRWLFLNPKLHESAREIDQDIKGHRFSLLSTLRPYRSGEPERWNNLLSVLWHEETMPTAWLRHIYGASMNVVQEIAESSELNRVYRCLDCELPLDTRGRDLILRRRRSLNTIIDADPGGIVPAESLCDLLCTACTEVYLYARQISIEDLRAMPYSEYLRSLEWQKIREEKLKQAGRYCHACRRLGLLEVHHNFYGHLADEDMSDLFIFCRSCHQRHHGIRRSAA